MLKPMTSKLAAALVALVVNGIYLGAADRAEPPSVTNEALGQR